MIRIEVTTYNGQPIRGELVVDFDELGGNIGRAEGNALVLPDPERLISRIHASVMFRAGSYLIRDLSSGTPVFVNGNPLGNGREVILRAGDEIRIGGYMMRASVEPASGSGGALAVSSGTAGPSRVESSLPMDNPFADLISPAPTPPAQSPKPPAAAPAFPKNRVVDDLSATPRPQKVAGPIPDDFDPFAQPTPSPAGAPKLPDDFDAGLGGFTTKRSIDELYDLSGSRGAGSLTRDSPLESSSAASLGGMPVDPLEALGAVRPSKVLPAGAQRDDVPELHANFRIPASKADPAMLPHAYAGTGRSAMDLSEEGRESPGGAGKPSLLLQVPGAGSASSGVSIESRSQPEPDSGLLPQRDTPRRAEAPLGPTQSLAATPASTRFESAAVDQLLREFLAGAGVPDLEMPSGLTPRLMNMLGQLLRESTQGTLDLLRARALLKREMRADMTMIVERENNPLKFSPDVQAAMTHLLAPKGPGYMTPLRAMKDAYNDLRAHEFGFMAGMRAALAGVLARFSPEQLERRLAEGTVMDKILPMNRKAKRWDLFMALYEDLSREAEDDFQTLFGKEFLRAYAAQIAKLEQDDKGANQR